MGLEFTAGMITTLIGYIGDIFSDMSLLILLIVGVGLGILVVSAIVSAVRGH